MTGGSSQTARVATEAAPLRSAPPGGGGYRAGGGVVRAGVVSVLLSTVLAGTTFSVLPLFGMLSARDHRTVSLRAAPDVVLAAAPAPPPRPKVRAEREQKRRPRLEARPELRRPTQRVEALEARLSLGMASLAEGVGDFSLNFAVEPERAEGGAEKEALVFDLAELDSPPRPLARVRPIYPPSARVRGIEGFVEIVFVVGVDGTVADATVVRSEPGDLFVNATRAAARRWRFAPGKKDGSAVASRVRQVIRFRLEDR